MLSEKKREPRLAFTGRGSLTLAMPYSRTPLRCTTIGAAAFHCRVRNGDGWFHCAMITRRLVKPKSARGGRYGAGLTSTSPENLALLQRTGVFPEICIWEEIFLSSISKNDCVEQLIRCSDLSQTTQPISKQKTIKPNE